MAGPGPGPGAGPVPDNDTVPGLEPGFIKEQIRMTIVKAMNFGRIYYFKAESRTDAQTLVEALLSAGWQAAEVWS